MSCIKHTAAMFTVIRYKSNDNTNMLVKNIVMENTSLTEPTFLEPEHFLSCTHASNKADNFQYSNNTYWIIIYGFYCLQWLYPETFYSSIYLHIASWIGYKMSLGFG